MKTSIWDILTGVILIGILCVIGAVAVILLDPSSAINPFPPAVVSPDNVVTPIVIPSQTATLKGIFPPTWTPTPTQEDTKAPVNADGLRASSTPFPTSTVLVLPTFTPSRTARSGVGGGTCTITYQDPADNKSVTKGSSFDVRWTIKNTSNDTWRADSVDILYVNGDRMHAGNDARDMPYDVTPAGMLDLVVPMTAPSTGGAYVSNWRLVNGSRTLCSFYIAIRVP